MKDHEQLVKESHRLIKELVDVGNQAISTYGDTDFKKCYEVFNALTNVTGPLAFFYLQRGRCNWELRRWDKAEADFRAADYLDPVNSADIKWVLGLFYLQQNRFKDCWPLYERRWQSVKFTTPKLKTNKPRWKPGKGYKSVLVWPEQGVGDVVIYSSLLRELAKHVDKVTMLIDFRLLPIYQRSMPEINFEPGNTRVMDEDHDSHIPIASLGSHFINGLEDFERHRAVNFLKPDEEKANELRKRFGIKPEDFVVGVSWGSMAPAIGPHKSMGLNELLPVFNLENVKFINLQYGQVQPAIQELKEKHGVELICAEDIDNFLNLNGLTALMSLCDVVVSVSSATVHFAGAMGIPVLLFDANKLWYWGNKRGQQSLWYPSVKIFPRDSMATPWTRQILRVAHDVRKLRNAKLGIEEIEPPKTTFVFFHVGQDIYFPRKTVGSILATNPNAEIVMCTDKTTPHIEGVTHRFEIECDRNELMTARLKAFAKLRCPHPAMYIDTDMLVQQKLDAKELLGDKEVLFCRRFFQRDYDFIIEQRGIRFDEYAGKKIDEVYPIIACFTVTKDFTPWVKMYEMLEEIDPKYRKWYGDQEVMKRLAVMAEEFNIGYLSEEDYGCLPEFAEGRSPKVLHYKGPNRKEAFEVA